MSQIDEVIPAYHAAAMKPLREQLPEVRNIEEIREFEEIKLINTSVHSGIIQLTYDVLCPDLFPSVRARLLEREYVTENNISHAGPVPQRNPSEAIMITIGYYGNRLQITLQCRKSKAETIE